MEAGGRHGLRAGPDGRGAPPSAGGLRERRTYTPSDGSDTSEHTKDDPGKVQPAEALEFTGRGQLVCAATKRDGTPCRSFVGPDGVHCSNHDPDPIAQEQARVRRATARLGKKKPRALDIVRERAEANADEITRVYLEGMKATKWMYPGEGAPPIEVPDHETRRKAVDSWLDRGFGKPKQQTELSFDKDSFLDVLMGRSPAESIEGSATLRQLTPAHDESKDDDEGEDAA